MVWYGRVGLKDKVKSSLSPVVCRFQKFCSFIIDLLEVVYKEILMLWAPQVMFCVIVISNQINYCLLVACHATLYPALSVSPSICWLVGWSVRFLFEQQPQRGQWRMITHRANFPVSVLPSVHPTILPHLPKPRTRLRGPWIRPSRPKIRPSIPQIRLFKNPNQASQTLDKFFRTPNQSIQTSNQASQTLNQTSQILIQASQLQIRPF